MVIQPIQMRVGNEPTGQEGQGEVVSPGAKLDGLELIPA